METWTLPEGAVTMQKEGYTVRFRVDCKPPCELSRLLRCYGENPTLLVGVLEPKNGRLTLDRRISRETLRQSGAWERLPRKFYLSDGGAREAEKAVPVPDEAARPEAPQTGEKENPVPKSADGGMVRREGGQMPGTAPETLPQTGDVPPVKIPHAPQKGDIPPVKLPDVPQTEDVPSTLNLPQTGDALLDAALARGEVHCEPSPEGWRITCPFCAEKPFPLAFAAPLCRTEDCRIAVLDWKKPQGAP